MKRLVFPMFCLLLLSACAEGQEWGNWFPTEKVDEDHQFFCGYYGNCPKPKAENCSLWGNCPDDRPKGNVWGPAASAPTGSVWGPAQ